ncbi:MAG: DUF512 domain-containing protein [Clostridia bacterium]
MKNRAPIKSIEPGSIARGAGIEPGDILLSVNGCKIKDVFDYRFSCASEKVLLEIQKKNNEIWEIEIEKEEDEDLGIVFEHDLIDREKSCINKCIFCFIDQLPPSMRKTLYFKDDDARLSFLTGNYVTLTNMDHKELERIAGLRLSPVNISVHATEPAVRAMMLNNRHGGDILEKITYLAGRSITMNCQVVLCRGINDDSHLEKTVEDLVGLYPRVNSLSVVPVGLTKYRQGLYPLEPYDRQSSREVLGQLEKLRDKYQKAHGVRFVYPADEFYLMAGEPIPHSSAYDGFPQLENGVGLVASLRDEILDLLEHHPGNKEAQYSATMVTGMLALGFIREMAGKVMEKHKGVHLEVFGVENKFFGEHVNVAGLLTGNDIMEAMKGKDIRGPVLITSCMLRSDGEVFLDDMSLKELETTLGTRVIAVANTGRDFIGKATGGQ